MSKYIFITGGVVSGLGKGITSASVGRLLIERGYRVSIQKFDPSYNINLSTANPSQYGEIFVTHDGKETSAGIGNYERFLDRELGANSIFTSGEIYSDVLGKESRGEFAGSTIQIVPHITSAIKSAMRSMASDDIDIVIVEIGGTIGDMDVVPYLEALRQFERELREDNFCHIHCTLLPYMSCTGELKTKPTQYSVRELMAMGLNPDIIVCRTERDVELTLQTRKKIAMFCNLDSSDCVIHDPDVDTVYEVPINLQKQGIDRIVIDRLGLELREINLNNWQNLVDNYLANLPTVDIAVVGKYTGTKDTYLSLIEAIKHAGFNNKYKAKITIVSAEDIEMMGAKEILKNFDGVVVAGGFGNGGIEGKILTAQYCRENKVPYLGIGLGMETSIIEFARNVVGYRDAGSMEFEPNTSHPVIVPLKDNQYRLGAFKCSLKDSSMARRQYGMPEISERHRHRYMFNNEYCNRFVEMGLVIAGVNEDENIVEVVEYEDHPYFVATLFHPEFKSRPNRPHPLFIGLIRQAVAGKR